MGLFDILKGKNSKETPAAVTFPITLCAASKGKYVASST